MSAHARTESERRSLVTVLWSNPSLYLSDCLTELRKTHDVRVVYTTSSPLPAHANFDGASVRASDGSQVVCHPRTSVVLVGGWRNRDYLKAARSARKHGAVPILAIDTQAKGGLRRKLVQTGFGLCLRTVFGGVFVPGDRQEKMARDLGFTPERVEQGLYACQQNIDHLDHRDQFVWVGRLVPAKSVATFIDAYERYRDLVGDAAWPADIVGDGEDRDTVKSAAVPGLVWRGRLEPHEVRQLMATSGCFVSSSVREPWGMVIAEAAAAGLPIVCTAAAGAGDHLVETEINGHVVPVADVEALANAMAKISSADRDQREAMSARSLHLATTFTAEAWPERLLGLAERVRR